jgi:hypothetical protein
MRNTIWRAVQKSGYPEHFAHLVNSERAIQQLLRSTLAGATRDVLLRQQYPASASLAGIAGDPSAWRFVCRESGSRSRAHYRD